MRSRLGLSLVGGALAVALLLTLCPPVGDGGPAMEPVVAGFDRRGLFRFLWHALAVGLFSLPLVTAWLDSARFALRRRYGFLKPKRRVVILGFDGVDPRILKEYLDRDRLPAIAALARQGTLLRCRTTNPPESPVAWATFATGRNPGGHGIFDFVRRDPSAASPYRPINALLERVPPELGPFGFPFRPPRAVNRRGGECFWEPVARSGYRVSMLRMPLTFPAEPLRGGELLCGLGVPDLRATSGSYTLFAAGRNAWSGYTEFGGRHLKIYPRRGQAESVLEGPPDPRAPRSGRRLELPIRFTFTGQTATVSIDGGPAVAIGPERYSRWVQVTFRAALLVRVRGLVRFRLLAGGDEPAVYASPIQIAPDAPPLPISEPDSFAVDLAERLGPMKTAGWPEDTFAANDGVLDDVQAFEDIRETYLSQERTCLDRLDSADAALLATVFTATDRVQHIYFRYRDELHPAHDRQRIADFVERTGVTDPIFESYRWMDNTVAEVRGRLRPNDVLMVLSDHGFCTWRHQVNLNTWLRDEGYLVLADEQSAQPTHGLDGFFRHRSETGHLDWKKTRAYALGLGQIYVNLKGREADGTVDPAHRASLLAEIAAKLLRLKGPDGRQVVSSMYMGDDVWHGERVGEAPDAQCGFAEGYRVSWQTCLLGVPDKVIEPNDRPWSGDHCSLDQAAIPGIFLCNHELAPGADPGLEDIAPTVCRLFDVPPPEGADGQALPLRIA